MSYPNYVLETSNYAVPGTPSNVLCIGGWFFTVATTGKGAENWSYSNDPGIDTGWDVFNVNYWANVVLGLSGPLTHFAPFAGQVASWVVVP